jgi:hypothetical protein
MKLFGSKFNILRVLLLAAFMVGVLIMGFIAVDYYNYPCEEYEFFYQKRTRQECEMLRQNNQPVRDRNLVSFSAQEIN